MSKKAKTPAWCYIAVLIIVFISINIQITSTITKNVAESKMGNVAEMVITEEVDFIKLQNVFQNRYNADASVTYILQPKDYVKLYKKAVSSQVKDSTNLYIPNKVNLKDESVFQNSLNGQGYVRMDSKTNFENQFLLKENKNYQTLYVFPIYHYDIHVAEIYLFYKDTTNFTPEKITSITSEIQSLSRLIE